MYNLLLFSLSITYKQIHIPCFYLSIGVWLTFVCFGKFNGTSTQHKSHTTEDTPRKGNIDEEYETWCEWGLLLCWYVCDLLVHFSVFLLHANATPAGTSQDRHNKLGLQWLYSNPQGTIWGSALFTNCYYTRSNSKCKTLAPSLNLKSECFSQNINSKENISMVSA